MFALFPIVNDAFQALRCFIARPKYEHMFALS